MEFVDKLEIVRIGWSFDQWELAFYLLMVIVSGLKGFGGGGLDYSIHPSRLVFLYHYHFHRSGISYLGLYDLNIIMLGRARRLL